MPAELAALGALLSGIASLIAAILSNRSVKRRERGACEQRIEDIRTAFAAGLKYEPREPQRKAT